MFEEFMDQADFQRACTTIKICNSSLTRLEKLYQYAESVSPVSSELKIHHLLDRIVSMAYDQYVKNQDRSTLYSTQVETNVVGHRIANLHSKTQVCSECKGDGVVPDE